MPTLKQASRYAGLVSVVILTPLVLALSTVVILTSNQRKVVNTQHILPAKIASVEGVILRGELAEKCKNHDSDIVVIDIKDGETTINNTVVERGNFEQRLREVMWKRRCNYIFIDADPRLSWGDIVYLVDSARGVGALSLIMTDKLKEELGYPSRTERPLGH